jgi:tetratricopeptide (TPR) repeat protein
MRWATAIAKARRYTGIGVALAALGRLPEAEQRLEEALSIRQEMGDEPGEARTRLWLGNVRRDQGWHAKARAEYEASLAILRSVGDRYHEGIALWQIGVAAQQQGESETSRATWRHALSILETLGCTEADEVRRLLVHEPAGSAKSTAQTE